MDLRFTSKLMGNTEIHYSLEYKALKLQREYREYSSIETGYVAPFDPLMRDRNFFLIVLTQFQQNVVYLTNSYQPFQLAHKMTYIIFHCSFYL